MFGGENQKQMFITCTILHLNYSYMWVPFLEPEDMKILSLGAIWNFGKGTGLS
jgi:hypothetical protein